MLYGLRQSGDIAASHQAIFAADSGIECVLFKKAKDPSRDCGEIEAIKLANGASYKTVPAADGSSVKSVGRAGRSSRALEIAF